MEGKIRLNSLEPVREGRLRGFGHVLRRVTLEDVEDGAAGQEVKKKTTEKIHGCEHAEGLCDRRGF